MAWLPPELELGEDPELKPPELDPEFVELDPEFAEPEPVELEPVELEPVELEPEEPELAEAPEPELDEEFDVPVEVDPLDAVLLADPGRARASAPAVTTLATVTVVVADRTLARPRSLAATAWRIPSSRRALLMSFIVQSRCPESLHEPSGPAMSRPQRRAERYGTAHSRRGNALEPGFHGVMPPGGGRRRRQRLGWGRRWVNRTATATRPRATHGS